MIFMLSFFFFIDYYYGIMCWSFLMLKQPFSFGGVIGRRGLSNYWWWINMTQRTLVTSDMSSQEKQAGQWINSNHAFIYKINIYLNDKLLHIPLIKLSCYKHLNGTKTVCNQETCCFQISITPVPLNIYPFILFSPYDFPRSFSWLMF